MPRTRQLKHDFFLNEDLAALDPMARLLFIGLWVLADREGRLKDRPVRIKAQLFPYHDADVHGLLDALSGFVVRYEADGVRYLQVQSFTKHQHVHYAEKQSTIAKCPVITGNHKIKPVIIATSTSTSTSTSTGPKPKQKFIIPTEQEVGAYCRNRKNGINPAAFIAHYEANGWKVGKNPVKNWKACVHTWECNSINGVIKKDPDIYD